MRSARRHRCYTASMMAFAAIGLLTGRSATSSASSIPPPDESHAMHRIGVCGAKHYEPRLEFCDARDNRVYRKVKIGTQTWMGENLAYGGQVSGAQNQDRPGEKYCLHDDAANCAALYQWAEAMSLDAAYNAKTAKLTGSIRGICPQGWHVPSSTEWATLLHLVDREQGAEDEAMSLMYISHDPDFKWKTNTNPDDVLPHDRYGLEVVPTGARVTQGDCPVGPATTSYFCNAHDRAFFWTSDDNAADGDPATAVDYVFTEDLRQVAMDNIAHNPVHKCDEQRFGAHRCAWKQAQKTYGMAIRCVQNAVNAPASEADPGRSVPAAAPTPR